MGDITTNKENILKRINLVFFLVANLLYMFLAFSNVFGYDEAYTIGLINRDFQDIIQITSNDVHSPLYYFALKLFYTVPGMHTLISTRVFSWIFMSLQLYVGGRICRKLYGRKVEFYWMLLSGFMPAMIMQAANARMYAMGMFFATVVSYLAYSLYRQSNRKKWILFTIMAVIAVYIHTFCMIEMVIVYGVFIFAVLRKRDFKMLGKIFASGACVSIGFLPWLSVLYHQFMRWAGKEAGWGNTIEKISWRSFGDYIAEWFSSAQNPNLPVIMFSLVLVVIASGCAIKHAIKTRDWLPCLGMIIPGITFLIAMIVSVFIVPCFLGRYLFFAFGGVWLFIAVGISNLKYMWVKKGIVVGVLLCGLVTFGEEMKLRDDEGLETYLACMDAELEENDVIMADSYFTLMLSIYYPDADYMVYGGINNVPFDNVTAFTQWEQLDGVDRVWYLSFSNLRRGSLDERYTVVDTKSIPYSYYDIVLEKYIRK